METIYGILGLAVFIGIGYLMWKGKRFAWKAVNKNILYRSEYQEGQQLVSEPLIIETAASIHDLMRELDAHVETAESNTAYKPLVYQVFRSNDRINYAFGNKFVPKTFEAVVMFSSQDEKTVGTYKMLTWHERDGIVSGQNFMKRLRKQVKAGFTAAADGALKINQASVKDNNIVEQQEEQKAPEPLKSPKVGRTCQQCGGFVRQDQAFCTTCGNKNVEIKRCKLCDSQLPENASYCVICGWEVDEIQDANRKLLCPSCGMEISKNTKFCTKCGNKIKIY